MKCVALQLHKLTWYVRTYMQNSWVLSAASLILVEIWAEGACVRPLYSLYSLRTACSRMFPTSWCVTTRHMHVPHAIAWARAMHWGNALAEYCLCGIFVFVGNCWKESPAFAMPNHATMSCWWGVIYMLRKCTMLMWSTDRAMAISGRVSCMAVTNSNSKYSIMTLSLSWCVFRSFWNVWREIRFVSLHANADWCLRVRFQTQTFIQ